MTGRELVFGAAAIAFAVTSAWLAVELKAERAKVTTLEDSAIVDLAKGRHAPSTTNSITAPVTVADERPLPRSELSEHAQRADALRKLLDDPRPRQTYVDEARASIRHSFPELARQLGLSAAETDALVDLLVQQSLRAANVSADCRGDLQCWRTAVQEETEPRRAELEALLGPEKLERFEHYRDSLSERRTVRQFQVMLPPEHALSDSDAERLIYEMAQERRDTEAAAEARGEYVDGFGTIFGDVLVRQDVDAQARYDSGEQFSHRLRARTGRILTPEQFEVFSRMQDDMLTSMRSMIDQKVQ